VRGSWQKPRLLPAWKKPPSEKRLGDFFQYNKAMYQLYIANKNYSSWSLRPWLVMKQLGIAFDEHMVPFSGGSNWEAFRRFSPTGNVPCLVDGSLTVWDSLAITEYLAERHSNVWPQDAVARAWARCVSAEMHSGFQTLRGRCGMNCGIRIRLKPAYEEAKQQAFERDIRRLDELWAEGLDRFGGPFLAGKQFTAADAFFAPVAFRVQTYGIPVAPRSLEYVQRLLELTGMQAWYAAALAEPWRELAHETEVLETGELLEDLRRA
jgi:glutathione S-transferase